MQIKRLPESCDSYPNFQSVISIRRFSEVDPIVQTDFSRI